MKFLYLVIVTVFSLFMASAAYATSTASDESKDCSSIMEMSGDKSGKMYGMHGEGKMHEGMMGHHMMHSGVSPVTIMIQPGMMQTKGHGTMKQDTQHGYKGHRMNKEMMIAHMEKMEQRLANIKALLSELVELQSQN